MTLVVTRLRALVDALARLTWDGLRRGFDEGAWS